MSAATGEHTSDAVDQKSYSMQRGCIQLQGSRKYLHALQKSQDIQTRSGLTAGSQHQLKPKQTCLVQRQYLLTPNKTSWSRCNHQRTWFCVTPPRLCIPASTVCNRRCSRTSSRTLKQMYSSEHARQSRCRIWAFEALQCTLRR